MTPLIVSVLLAFGQNSYPSPHVQAPTVAPAGGTYSSTQSVTCSTGTLGAATYYSTDGSYPQRTPASRYSGPISVSTSQTVCCRSERTGRRPSANVCNAYTINLTPWPLVGTIHRYVATAGNGGSNANDGTAGHPWATIAYAATQATAGMIIHIGDGTYTGLVDIAWGGSSWAAPVTFVADNATRSSWPVTIDGTGNTRAVTMEAQYVVVQGINITCSTNTCYGGIHSYTSHYKALGNNIHYTPPDCNSGGAGIQSDCFDCTDITSDGNVIHDIFVNTSCGLTHGIYYASPNAGTIINNLLYNNSGWGIHLYHCAQNVVIANNTVMTSGHSGILVGSFDDCGGLFGTGNVIVNNLVTNSTNGCIEENNSGRTCHNTFLNNTCYANGGAGNTIALLPACGGGAQSTVSSTLTSNPLYTNYQANGSGDYTLQAGSPSVDSGSSTSAPDHDYNFVSRPTGGGFDRGAYER
jgi:parallel beta-helix repeat protein